MRLFFIAVMLLPPGLGATPLALVDGEHMTFHVGWGVFAHAGEITVSARRVSDQMEDRLCVTTTTRTRGFLRGFFPFDASAEAWFDPTDGRLLHSSEESRSKKKQTRQSLVFDHDRRRADYINILRPERNATLPLPDGNPMDLIMSLVQTRTWNLKPGEKQDALVVFDDDFYELTIYAEAYEQIRTALGTFKALRLTPRMEKSEPKGMFKRGSAVNVWISQDGRNLPVRFEVDFKFGAGVATLAEHRITPATSPDVTSAGPGQHP